ncbi:hypothetical protein A2865_04260 [Candidatus Woesebacteria bacterium RIFCSPHIGHO2_01_FULL_39_17]|nr:MAG: hypothetical protein UT19_C0016G0003 [Candidatus Woesebacteria bacterium GW2011_GWB1_39_10b]OGM23335.1 MAG: hypothetical protein A2865_04260 [Candidatus Woesebacteria bacterium RIFCSPHIGHO2_01_FULL_39_17]
MTERVAISPPLIPLNCKVANLPGLVFEIRPDDPMYFAEEPHFKRPEKPLEITEASPIAISDVITGEPFDALGQLQQPEPPLDPEKIVVDIISAKEFSPEKINLELPYGYGIPDPSTVCRFLLGKQSADSSAFQDCFGDVVDRHSSLGNPFSASSGTWRKPIRNFTFEIEGGQVIIGGKPYTPDQLKLALSQAAVETEIQELQIETPAQPNEVITLPQKEGRDFEQIIEEFDRSPLYTKCAAGFVVVVSVVGALYATIGIIANRGVRSKKND